MKLAALLAAASLALAPAFAADEIDTNPAMTVAQDWLAMLDQHRFAESWEALSGSFQATVTRPQWEEQMLSVRGPLGVATSRKVRSATYGRTMPGVPEGEYVVIQFDTRFEHRPLTIETVTPLREPGGPWKVSGYHIR